MFVISKTEFVEEIKAELYGYEEIEEADIQDFMNRLDTFFREKKGKNVDYKKGISIKLKDESDLFMIVDRYLAALTNDELDQYWKNWDI